MIVGFGIVAALVVAGCGGEGEGVSAADPEVSTASTTSTAATSESASSEDLSTELGDPEPDPGRDDDDSDDDDSDGGDAETVTVTVEDEPTSGPTTTTAATSTTLTQSTTTSTTGSTTTSNRDDQEVAGDQLEDLIATRYEAFWQAFGQARAAPSADPATDFPALAELATGEQLEEANRELIALSEAGQALRRPENPAVPGLDIDTATRIRVDQVDGDSADLVACFVNDQISYRVADGAVVNDAVVTVRAEATMVRVDEVWKLASSRAISLDPGVAGCWLEDESTYPL